MPVAIISNRDPIFTSKFWQSLFTYASIQLRMSSSYHPQSDGQTERVNQCLETFLRCFVHTCPRKWKSWLAAAEFWYNSCFHSALGRSPFEALYGRQPRILGVEPNPAAGGKLDDWLSEKAIAETLIKQYLSRAVDRMKKQADKRWSEREFEVGGWVYMKLQPYVQSSALSRANLKLGFKYFGPFKVTARVGSVAYRLDLSATSLIHPVVHVSQLRLAAGFKGQVCSTLPSDALQYRVPLQVLGSRIVSRDANQIAQVQIKWSKLPDDLATWEDYLELHRTFHNAPA
jgi:hypothetical protein